jgi:hypothetical protein
MRDVKLTATYFLTTDHAKSRFDQPILVNKATGQAYLPSDSLAAYESWPLMLATQVVNKMASWRDFSGEERRLVERFLGVQSQPEVPGRRTRDESGSPRSLTLNWLSR